MPKQKPNYAVLEDVLKCESDWRAAVTDARGEAEKSLREVEKKIEDDIQVVKETANQDRKENNGTAQRLAQDSKAYTDESVRSLEKKTDSKFASLTQDLRNTEEALQNSIQQVDMALRSELADTVKELCDNFEQELMALKAEMEEQVRKTAEDAKAARQQQREELDAAIKVAKEEASARSDSERAWSQEQHAEMKRLQAAGNKAQDDKAHAVHEEVKATFRVHEQKREENAAHADKMRKKTKAELLDALQKLREQAEAHLGDLDKETATLRDAVAETENISTRRVDWVIKNASKVLKEQGVAPPLNTSASGDASNSSKAGPARRSWFSPKFNMCGSHGLQLELHLFGGPTLRGNDTDGDTAVSLWACKGENMHFRLHVGKKYETLDQSFSAHMPASTNRFCWIKDQIDPLDDTLRVSVEILESHRRIDHIIEAPLYPPAVENHVQLMKSRMVRNVEWRVEHASKLPLCFPSGEALCSCHFNAAGVEGLQFVLYPSGYKGASEGFISMFLSGPAGCTLKCWLAIGAQRRECKHTFDQPGAFGRTNFCRFDTVVDEAEDVLIIRLEVDEASFESKAQGDRELLDGSKTSPVPSLVKLVANAGKPCPGLEDTRMLPSLWTTAFQSNLPTNASAPDGMHTFEELRSGTPLKAMPGMRTSGSMPTLTNSKAERTAMQEDLGGSFSALPQLAAKTAGPGGFEHSTPGRLRRPRRLGAAATATAGFGVAAH
eukprot:TRINITY_DN27706_c0_g1_i3.p1 TRINITY_DN27706_c0_g1~~TRINITY_DN27706_c0_g1_i3.p1  ORF type:complete len:724 (-),score=228.40 TRINITY_DN27706_c0_g1_i3:378-2549(-)